MAGPGSRGHEGPCGTHRGRAACPCLHPRSVDKTCFHVDIEPESWTRSVSPSRPSPTARSACGVQPGSGSPCCGTTGATVTPTLGPYSSPQGELSVWPSVCGTPVPSLSLPPGPGGVPCGDTGSGSQRPPTCGRCRVPSTFQGVLLHTPRAPLHSLRFIGSLGKTTGRPGYRSVRPPNPVSSELPSHPGVCGRRAMPLTTPTSPEHRYPGGRAAPEPGDHRLTLTWADESQTRPLSSPDTLKMTQCVVRTPSGMGSWGTEPEPLTKGLQGPLPPWPGPPSAGGKASATSF